MLKISDYCRCKAICRGFGGTLLKEGESLKWREEVCGVKHVLFSNGRQHDLKVTFVKFLLIACYFMKLPSI